LATNPNNASPYHFQNIPTIKVGALPVPGTVQGHGRREIGFPSVPADESDKSAACELDEIEGMRIRRAADRL
jgi:hypothetical protein